MKPCVSSSGCEPRPVRGQPTHAGSEPCGDRSPGLLDGGADAFKGDCLSGAPQQQGSLLASYGMLLGGGATLELLYGYTYVGDVLTRIGRLVVFSGRSHAKGRQRPKSPCAFSSRTRDGWWW